MNKPLILVVEDDPSVRNLITTTLKTNDYRYVVAPNGSTAIMEATSHNPEIIWIWACRIWMAFKSFKQYAPGPMPPSL